MDYKIVGLKALGATSIVGGVAGGVYYYKTSDYEAQAPSPIKHLPKIATKTIREILADKGPLNTKDATDNETWKNLVAKYLDGSTEASKKMQIEGIDTTNTGEKIDTNVEIFKRTCEDLFLKTENDKNNADMAENWCTKESPILKATGTKARP